MNMKNRSKTTKRTKSKLQAPAVSMEQEGDGDEDIELRKELKNLISKESARSHAEPRVEEKFSSNSIPVKSNKEHKDGNSSKNKKKIVKRRKKVVEPSGKDIKSGNEISSSGDESSCIDILSPSYGLSKLDKSGALIKAEPLWYTHKYCSSEYKISSGSSDSASSTDKRTAQHRQEQYDQLAHTLLEQEAHNYKTRAGSRRDRGSAGVGGGAGQAWMQTVVKAGTLPDRVAGGAGGVTALQLQLRPGVADHTADHSAATRVTRNNVAHIMHLLYCINEIGMEWTNNI